ncbi:MAG: hypothetical protein V3V08_25655 [Nannocystaceae bacterium]
MNNTTDIEPEEPSRETIRQILREALHQGIIASAQRQLRNFTGVFEANIRYIDPETDLSFDHWISEISANMVGVKAHLRCHYSSTTARRLTERLMGKGAGDPSYYLSTLGELCNITMGCVKRRFVSAFREHYSAAPALLITTPDTYPSYDMATWRGSEGGRNRAWEIDMGDVSLLCESTVEIDIDLLVRDYALLDPERHESLMAYLCSISGLRAAILKEEPARPMAA